MAEEDVDMFCRQTTYTREEALEKLELLKDPIKVIQTYMNPTTELRKPRNTRNTHQMIFDEINKFVEVTSQQRKKV